MGRYVSTGRAQVNSCVAYSPTTCYQVSTHKYAYDATSCWPNRLIIDTPGSYTFTVPAGATCIRAIGVGGGGKSYCNLTGCKGTAGAGGAYTEAFNSIAAGCTVTIVVGRQQGDTTISYTCTGGNVRTLTAGGAVGSTPGVAAGGDWNSVGGCAGVNCNYCAAQSHFCGSCIYQYATTCCGYCVVWAGVSARQIDPAHTGDDCCNARYSGGGSAGSWICTCGGMGQGAHNAVPVLGSIGYGASAGGGGGIGYIDVPVIRSPWCSCICHRQSYNGSIGGPLLRNVSYPAAAGGGGGTKWQTCFWCVCQTYEGCCMQGRYREGPGGWGGKDNNEGREQYHTWVQNCGTNSHGPSAPYITRSAGPGPKPYPWHDIHEMAGSGSSGKSMYTANPVGSWVSPILSGSPVNSGEGAGTGGIVFNCCALTNFMQGCCIAGVDACGTLNWTLICCLGTSNKVCCADKMQQSIMPYIISCAGTLGGAGGVGVCHIASKAGKGGGSGVNRSYILCICHGGSFDLCNGSGAALAFPPSELDWRVSTAGTGMAVIYWK